MLSVGLLDTFALAGFGALIAWAALSDIRNFIIPNRIVVAILLLYPVHASTSFVQVDWPADLVTGIVVLFFGTLLFRAQIVGGGDVKLLAAVSIWAGGELALPMILLTVIAGGVLGVITLGTNVWVNRGTGLLTLSGLRKERLPYGAAIGFGGLYVIAQLLTV